MSTDEVQLNFKMKYIHFIVANMINIINIIISEYYNIKSLC